MFDDPQRKVPSAVDAGIPTPALRLSRASAAPRPAPRTRSPEACFIDNVLAQGSKEGYNCTVTPGTPVNGANTTYTSLADPSSLNNTGTKSFCSDQSGVIYYLPNATGCTPGSGSVLQ